MCTIISKLVVNVLVFLYYYYINIIYFFENSTKIFFIWINKFVIIVITEACQIKILLYLFYCIVMVNLTMRSFFL